MRSITLLFLAAGTLLYAASSKLDEKTGLVWQDNKAVAKVVKNYEDAVAYCDALEVDGFDDWRLPSLAEAYTIVDLRRDRPALMSGFEMRVSERFWTATPFAGDPKAQAWRILMSYGEAESYTKRREHHVRCVRGEMKR